jgi:predicted DCC family thiol-disulfide oxidoreductase YuxK
VNPREILLVYDKECPLCDAYCRIRESIGTLRLVNARDASAGKQTQIEKSDAPPAVVAARVSR